MSSTRATPSRPRALCAALRHARKCLCQRIEHAATAPDHAFAPGFLGVVAAVEAGFRHEELIMETLGYVHLHEHRAENAVVLSALHRVLPDVEGGDCGLGREVLAALMGVLELHRLSSDLALAVAVPPVADSVRERAARARTLPGAAHGKAARGAAHVTTWRHHGR